MIFGDMLKQVREAKKMTQDDLASYLKVTRPTIAGYETKNRQPDYEKLEKISNLFEVSIDYLIKGTDSFQMEYHPQLTINEKRLDRDVAKNYKKLSPSSKQDVLKYIQLLLVNESHQ